jgi:sec-independent protein translocase protein TatB
MTIAGWGEILFVALLAFVIIGPKDLPKILFALGRFIRTLRQLSAEFMAEFEAIHHIKDLEDKHKTDKKKTNRKN